MPPSSNRVDLARAAFGSQDAHLSLMAHQSTELAELAGGRSAGLHGDAQPLRKVRVFLLPVAASMFILLTLASLLRHTSVSRETLWYVLMLVPVLFSLSAELTAFAYQAAEDDFVEFEKSRENWEVDNFPEGEIEEMFWIYKSHGFTDFDAKTVAETLSKYREFWVQHMLVHECNVYPRKYTSCLSGVFYSVLLSLAISTAFALCFSFSDLLGTLLSNTLLVALALLFPNFSKSPRFWLKRLAVVICLGLWQLALRLVAAQLLIN